MDERIEKLLRDVRAASRHRGWKPGQIWKGKAGPRCAARTKAGNPCPNPAYVNGLCGRHGGGLVMATLQDRRDR